MMTQRETFAEVISNHRSQIILARLRAGLLARGIIRERT